MHSFSVAIIDDEPLILKILERIVSQLAPDWTIQLFDRPEDVISALKSNTLKPDLVICDRIMPGIQGEEVLRHFMQFSPRSLRLLVTADTFSDLTADNVSHVHLFMAKPFAKEDVKDALNTVVELAALNLSSDLRNALGQLEGLPVLSKTYQRIAQVINSPNNDMAHVAHIICQDPGVAAKVLQIANSPFMGFGEKVSSVEDATKRLGLEMIKSLTLTIDLSRAVVLSETPAKPIINRALTSAFLARKLSKLIGGSKELSERAFSLCLLSCIGELYLMSQTNLSCSSSEFKDNQSMPLLITVYLLTLWGMEQELIHELRDIATNRNHNDRVIEAFHLAQRLCDDPFDQAIDALLIVHQDTHWQRPLEALKQEPTVDTRWE